MRNWRREVSQRLPLSGVPAVRSGEIVEELAGQLQSAYESAKREGLGDEEAAERALAQIPDWQKLDREIRAAEKLEPPEPPAVWRGWLQDWGFGLRMIRRYPAVALGIVATLALAIGGTASVFSVLESVVLRTLDFRDPDRLVMVWESNGPRNVKQNVVAPADLLDWQRRNTVFSQMSAYMEVRLTLTGLGEPEELTGHMVSPGMVTMLGITPLMGRDFGADAGRAESTPEVVISHSIWLRKFAGDPAVLKRTMTIGGRANTIIGVLPADVQWLGKSPDVLVPFFLNPATDYRKRAGRYLQVAARLRDHVTVEQAQSEMSQIAKGLEEEYPDFNRGWGVRVVPMHEQFAGTARPALKLLMGAVVIVLLIACANIANLLLARTLLRSREMAVRASLGCGGGRLVRQLFTENALLALLGGALGCALAAGGIRILRYVGPQDLPRLDRAALNWPVVAFAAAITAAAALLFGLAPALAAARPQLVESLKAGSRGSGTSRHGGQLRRTLIAAEVGLALALMVGAGLFLRSYWRVMSIDPGFDARNVLTVAVGLPATRYREPAQSVSFYQQLHARVKQLPGVVSASAITFLAFSGPGAATRFRVVGRPEPSAGKSPVTDVRVVQPEYFETLRIPLHRGRTFERADNQLDSPRRFVVNQAMVKAMFPGQDPLGQRLIVNMGDDKPGEIIGVVGDIRANELITEARPMVYYPHAHLPMNFASLVIRTHGDPRSLVQSVLGSVHALDRDLAGSDIRLLEEWVDRSESRRRFQTQLLVVFAALAVLLAVVGIYAVVSHSVAERRPEIGLRMAIGAESGQLVRWVVGGVLKPALVGFGLGLAGVWLLRDFLKPLLFGIEATDVLTYAGTLLLLLAICVFAAWGPAWRAARMDPSQALRTE